MSDREFGWHGWVLVGAILVSFFVVPGVILALPGASDRPVVVGLSFRDAYLVLPLVPAVLLAVLGVWAALRSRRK